MSGLYTRRRKKPEMNLLPLIDVLVMLIFFAFVTMQFRSAATLNITLPKAETAGKNEFKGTVTIAVNKEGQLIFNEKIISDDQLEGLLREVRVMDKEIPVLIKADENSQLKKAIFIMDSCRKVGLNKFALQSATGDTK
jgi:biopolymer transport protein ExbD